MGFDPIYLTLAIFIFGMNVIPFFMPPTWIVLAFFYTHFHLGFFPTVLVGVAAAASGRVILYTLAKHYFRSFFSKKTLKNYDVLGEYLRRNQHLTIPIVLTYAFFPIPSNQVFIIAGLSKLNISIIASSFIIGRLFSYAIWVDLAAVTVSELKLIFIKYFSSTSTIALDLLGVGIIILVGKFPWKRFLRV